MRYDPLLHTDLKTVPFFNNNYHHQDAGGELHFAEHYHIDHSKNEYDTHWNGKHHDNLLGRTHDKKTKINQFRQENYLELKSEFIKRNE